MKPLIGLILVLCAKGAAAEPLTPVTGESLAGIPLAQALTTLRELDLPRGPRMFTVMSKPGGECGVSDMDDADTCPRFTLFALEWGETSVPVDFTLFRLPETLGWSLPKDAKVGRAPGFYEVVPLNACEMKKTAQGYGWKGTSYELRISEDLKTGADGYGHYVFTADLHKLPDERDNCGEYPASNSR